ncbi:DUF2927 domain-containing protein [Dinoroseobacter sp. PD6]|uniref:DUF2927 domain-containing protein n=1 Tax=Dinoroseobacter sp. PD6 TaxID=3028384 RepID=UPI00237ADA6C|nr:DUF2927 domain-containing protein [Dinoroseobacter sp. PD6]MDD9717995.1 DUF2927 domain-containing protein [Dinoroseobacter sp. PD6]
MAKSTSRTAILGLVACACMALPGAADVQKSSQGTATVSKSSLAAYYATLEAQFLAQGKMKTARHVPNAPMDPVSLQRDFVHIALHKEYGSGLSASGSKTAKPLLRWETPVRVQVQFGPNVPKSNRAKDVRTISTYVNTLARATRHPITLNPHKPNFHVLVVTEAERKSLAKTLPKLIPGIAASTVNSIARMRPNHLCMVVAEPHGDRRKGFRRAVAIVRAEHPDRMRVSCIQEELAQGLGLSNDHKEVWPSIFNDDQEFALLTKRDEKLLGMLYDPRLRSGMKIDEVAPYLHAVASAQF